MGKIAVASTEEVRNWSLSHPGGVADFPAGRHRPPSTFHRVRGILLRSDIGFGHRVFLSGGIFGKPRFDSSMRASDRPNTQVPPAAQPSPSCGRHLEPAAESAKPNPILSGHARLARSRPHRATPRTPPTPPKFGAAAGFFSTRVFQLLFFRATWTGNRFHRTSSCTGAWKNLEVLTQARRRG